MPLLVGASRALRLIDLTHWAVELDACDGSGWSPKALAGLRDSLNSLNNKDLVEQTTGCEWLGFKGQTLELV